LEKGPQKRLNVHDRQTIKKAQPPVVSGKVNPLIRAQADWFDS
jgi:hypothetical protein